MFSGSGTFNVQGSVRLKTINSPNYFKQMQLEAFSIFKSPEAIDVVAKIFSQHVNKQKIEYPKNMTEPASKFLQKLVLTGGTFVRFLDGSVSFKEKDNLEVINDIIAEITIKDGLVTKIACIEYPKD